MAALPHGHKVVDSAKKGNCAGNKKSSSVRHNDRLNGPNVLFFCIAHEISVRVVCGERRRSLVCVSLMRTNRTEQNRTEQSMIKNTAEMIPTIQYTPYVSLSTLSLVLPEINSNRVGKQEQTIATASLPRYAHRWAKLMRFMIRFCGFSSKVPSGRNSTKLGALNNCIAYLSASTSASSPP